MYVDHGPFLKNSSFLAATGHFLRPSENVGHKIFLQECLISELWAQTLNGHQIHTFDARDLIFNILNSLYINNLLCLNPLAKPAFLNFTMGWGCKVPPPPPPPQGQCSFKKGQV